MPESRSPSLHDSDALSHTHAEMKEKERGNRETKGRTVPHCMPGRKEQREERERERERERNCLQIMTLLPPVLHDRQKKEAKYLSNSRVLFDLCRSLSLSSLSQA